ncbi:MAG TPA: HAMP domain-containing sensor histidine kinase [Streptosporangiaceae bacterium]|nr:HAMP domain-containing sensor histidine kinase [Streptosporangiaceae bacterium]
MSLQSGFSRRWQKVRRLPGRIPLRIKLITAVLALVFIALGVISVAGISVLRSYLLGQVDTQLADSAETTQHTVSRCLSDPSPCPFYSRGLTIYWLPTGGPTQQIVLAAQNPFAMPSQQEPIPGPALSNSQSWTDSIVGKPVTVPAVTGDGRWRVLALPATANNNLTGQATNGTIIIGIDVSSVYSTLGALVIIDLIVSGIVLVALAIVGIAIVRTSLRPLTDIELTAGAIAAGDLSERVPDRDPRTEVGRLGRSLNTMLAQVEAAFHARENSEAAALRSEEKMRQFVADASHELRTPLTAIRGYAEYYRQRGGVGNGARHAAPADAEPILGGGGRLTEPDIDRIMQRVEQESARMGVLVEDMLLLARLDQQRPLERRPVDLLTLAADAVQDARMIAPQRKIDLTVGRGAAFLVLGDEARLRQVITNLMSNALSHTPDGTPIDVRILAHGPDGRLPVPSVTIEVDDHGAGLSKEQAERVFERFYRADQARGRKTGGAGLGLAIVAALVDAHGGAVGVDTAPGTGAMFWITLPLAAEAA